MTFPKTSTMVFSNTLGYFTILLILFLSIAVVHISSESLCEELPVIHNGVLEDDQQPPFRVNDTLLYKCNEFFKSEERFPKVTCVLNDSVANWTESACKRMIISCGDPGYISNADREGLLFSFPNSIRYVCHDGFRMIGVDTKFCSAGGHWQPSRVPYCEEILCPALGDPANGKVVHSNRRVGSTADYLCDRYYKLLGNSKRECLTNGSWSGNSPVCEKITCKAPDKFPNGRIIGKKDTVYNASDILIFRCNDGVTHSTSKCLENGEWNHPPPTCPGTIVVEASSTTTHALTTLSESFPIEEKTEGSPVIETSSTSTSAPTTLVSDSPEGEAISCEDPGKIKNGDRAIVALHVNSTVTYICDDGYEIRGKSSLLCLENGKWDLDKLPICVKPVSPLTIVAIVFGVIFLILIGIGGFLWYRYKMKSIRGYGEKSKALTADATDIEEIAGLEREKKQIPVTVL